MQDDNFWVALFLTTISGLATGIGGVIVVLYGKPSFSAMGHMLSFSSGVMMYISFMDLLPEAASELGFFTANICFFGGMIFFACVVYFIPEIDAEKLIKKEKETTPSGKVSESYLLMVGIVTAVGISLHNFPEGVAVYLTTLKGVNVGIPLTLAIAAHNIPEGMAVAAPIYGSTKSRWQAIKWSTLSGLCEPLGALIVAVFFTSYLTNYMVQSLLAAVAGIMVYMCLMELIPATLKYIDPKAAMISNTIGMFAIFLSVHYLHEMLGTSISFKRCT